MVSDGIKKGTFLWQSKLQLHRITPVWTTKKG